MKCLSVCFCKCDWSHTRKPASDSQRLLSVCLSVFVSISKEHSWAYRTYWLLVYNKLITFKNCISEVYEMTLEEHGVGRWGLQNSDTQWIGYTVKSHPRLHAVQYVDRKQIIPEASRARTGFVSTIWESVVSTWEVDLCTVMRTHVRKCYRPTEQYKQKCAVETSYSALGKSCCPVPDMSVSIMK